MFRCGALMLHYRVCPPGGAISNMYAMLLARFKMFPEVKEKGMSSVPRLAAFTSEHVSVFICFQFFVLSLKGLLFFQGFFSFCCQIFQRDSVLFVF